MGSNPIFRSRPHHEALAFSWRRTQVVREQSAKLSFTSSNLVDASIISCRGGEIGRHKGLKIPRIYNVRAGSIPALGTLAKPPF